MRDRPATAPSATWRRRVGVLAALLAFGSAALAADCPPARPIAAGVYVIAGTGGAPSRKNGGRVGNSLILVGSSGLVIVDPGPTRRHGRAVACSARRLSPLPVAALINTHPHPENVLANGAFGAVPIYAAASAIDAMQERCRNCQQRLAAELGESAMAGTRVVVPGEAVATAITIRPGGRALRLIPLGVAHSPGDLAIVDLATQTLIGGDAATVGELPDLRDGTTRGAIAALESLQAIPARRVVPGRGPAFAPARLAEPLNYLRDLAAAAAAAADAGDWPPLLAREAEYARRFSRFAELHPLNLQHAQREAESEWWTRPHAADGQPSAADVPTLR